jgi:putative endonuclease
VALPVFKIGRLPLIAGGLGSTPRRFRHSTRPLDRAGLAHGKPFDSRACAMKPSHATAHSTRPGEAHPTDGPRRMALSDAERAHVSERVEGESKGQTAAPGTEPCFVYIVTCADGSYYVGSTSDVAERERIHNEGHGAEYTAARRPVRVIYSEHHESWPAARRREAQLKRWSRAKKEALIEGDRSRLHVLARRCR